MELLVAMAFLTLYVTCSSLQCRLLNVTYNVKKAITPMRSRHIWPRSPLIIHVSRQIPGSKITGVYQLGFPDFFLDIIRYTWGLSKVMAHALRLLQENRSGAHRFTKKLARYKGTKNAYRNFDRFVRLPCKALLKIMRAFMSQAPSSV